MQPTQQQVIPVSLYSAQLPSTSFTIPLLSAYDHVLSRIVAWSFSAAATYLQINDDDGNPLWGTEFQATGGLTFAPTIEGGEGIVLQSLTELQVLAGSVDINLSISAYRLAPSAAEIFA
jgi:hypothetical protein